MFDQFFSAFPAFKSRNYQLYFVSQLISLIGTWLQIIAQSWLVLELTNSAFMVGLVSALGFLPVLLFSLFGGVIIDRFHKKNLLIFTNSAAMVLAFALGFLAIWHILNIWILAVLAFLLGVVNALDVPTRQAFTIDLVGRDYLPSAIALNMGIFNSSRVIGPAIAGALIARFGNGGAFILNGLSFIVPITALVMMKIKSFIPETHPHPITAIKFGLHYAFTHPLIKDLIIFTVSLSIFGFSIATILPVVAKNVFHLDAGGLGLMYTASGLGALLGIGIVSWGMKRFGELQIILIGTIIFTTALAIFAFTTNLTLGLLTLFVQGAALSLPFAVVNSSIQHHVDNHVRGRVSSIYTLAFLGMQPFGSFQIGFLTEHFGSSLALGVSAVITLLAALLLWLSLRDQK